VVGWWRSSDLRLGAGLIALSGAIYLTQLMLFTDPKNTAFYILQDMAFLPVSILVVTLVIERILEVRDRHQRLEKLRMLIGTFFSWIGYHLLERVASFDGRLNEYAPLLQVRPEWKAADFERVRATIAGIEFALEIAPEDLILLRPYLHERAEFLIRLLENPMVLEHEAFTELLRGVFHLIEELDYRRDFADSPPSDIAHLTGDAARVYRLLVIEWIDHLQYLQQNYPYLFSLAVRINPYSDYADPVVRQ
jgi:hypothetical protein